MEFYAVVKLKQFQSSNRLRLNAVSDLHNSDTPLEGLQSRGVDNARTSLAGEVR